MASFTLWVIMSASPVSPVEIMGFLCQINALAAQPALRAGEGVLVTVHHHFTGQARLLPRAFCEY
ncbi:hypothetical protein [Pectobacterium brasiliense]|uniref:hypothetical protein n=1 Tax=Pectobacterium brasiliense TaxID=180957 RepID=UPI001F073D3D|nr:hypothetical protein [Pectobacterium brasiliense]